MSKSIILSAVVLSTGIAGAFAQSAGNLTGAIYLEGNFTGIATVAQAAGDINAASAPTATFLSSLVNQPTNGGNGYTGKDGSTVPQILGSIGDIALTDTSAGAPVGSFVLDIRGTLTVSRTGSYTFSDNNDDGGAFFINGNGTTAGSGQILAQNDGDHAPAAQSSTISLTAGTPYVIEYIGYNQGCQGCGFSGNADNSGGGVQLAADITPPAGGVVTVAPVSAVPEPSTWLAAGGLLLLAAGDFRRRLKA